MKTKLAAAVVAATAFGFTGQAIAEGNLAPTPSTPIELNIIGADALADVNSFDLETGVYYRLVLTSDGADEVLFTAPDLFNNSWLNQIVVDGVEIKLWGDTIKGVEVGEEGPNTVTITFLIIKPGQFNFYFNGEEAGVFNVI